MLTGRMDTSDCISYVCIYMYSIFVCSRTTGQLSGCQALSPRFSDWEVSARASAAENLAWCCLRRAFLAALLDFASAVALASNSSCPTASFVSMHGAASQQVICVMFREINKQRVGTMPHLFNC